MLWQTVEWKGRQHCLLCLCVFCPVWIIYEQVMIAALDCSRDDLALVSFRRTSSHTQKLHSLTTITTLQHLRCQMWKSDIYLAKWSLLRLYFWKNSLIRTGVSGCNKYVEMHASSVHGTWPSLTKFHLFFPLGFICHHKASRNYSEFRFRNMKMVKSACKTRRGGGVNQVVHLQSVWMWQLPLAKWVTHRVQRRLELNH